MNLARRDFFCATACCLLCSGKAVPGNKRPLAVQLYSVRLLAQADLARILNRVAQLGYQGVEFAGYYGHAADEIRRMLEENHLRVAGAHVKLETLLGEELAGTVGFNREMGNRTLIVPSIPEAYRHTIQGWRDAGRQLKELAAKLRTSGFTLGYHNHAHEFERIGGELPFDAFFDAAGTDIKVQLDVGHALQGGADPVDVLRRYRHRIASVHIKDYAPGKGIVEFGEGAMDWRSVFTAILSDRHIEWCISEEEAQSCRDDHCITGSIRKIREYL